MDPFFDTDVWVNFSINEQEDLLIDNYNTLNCVNTVEDEIKKERYDGKKDRFMNAGNKFDLNKDKINVYKYSNTSFGPEELDDLEELLKGTEIDFIRDNEKHITVYNTSDTGEKMSILVAFLLEKNLVLSDDKGSKTFRDIYELKSVEIKNSCEVLNDLKKDKSFINNFYRNIKEDDDLYKHKTYYKNKYIKSTKFAN